MDGDVLLELRIGTWAFLESLHHSCLHVADKDEGGEGACLLPKVRDRTGGKGQALEDKERMMSLILDRSFPWQACGWKEAQVDISPG